MRQAGFFISRKASNFAQDQRSPFPAPIPASLQRTNRYTPTLRPQRGKKKSSRGDSRTDQKAAFQNFSFPRPLIRAVASHWVKCALKRHKLLINKNEVKQNLVFPGVPCFFPDLYPPPFFFLKMRFVRTFFFFYICNIYSKEKERIE